MNRKLLLVFCVLVLGLATNALAQLPAGQDVGGPALAGSFSYDAGTDSWTVVGCGADIWGGWDQFHYVFRPLAGDGSGVVRVVSMDITHQWAKVGVMIRETLAGNSKHMMISMTGTHGVQTVWREQTGGASADVPFDTALPIYLKVERIGNTFNTYMTFNPAFWIPQHSVTIDMKPNVTIGMFVCSTDSGLLNTTVFDSVDLVAPAFNAAWAVSPDDGILADLAGETISWQPGDTAASHNVYFGTTSPPPLIGNQAETTYDTGPLEGGVTYYYQIDEVEADGTTVHAGEERSMYTIRPGTGTITREVWEGIGGVEVWDLTNNANYPANPSWSDEPTSLEAPTDFADNFGSRIHGWVVPETSGEYTFWIASDDSSDLWLSTSESPADAVRIAYVSGWAGSRQWDSQANQNSTNVVGGTIPLEGGQKYYISALYKEGGGGDNCSVAWEGPDNPTRGVIDGYYLMPFENLWAYAPSPADGATGVGMSPTLSWSPAVDAVSYEVYVDDALLGSTTETSIEAGPFALSAYRRPSTHTWRVDVVTNSPARTGATWTFTIANNRVIDDFQSYDAVPEGTAPQMLVGGDYTIAAVAPPEQTVIGGDITIEAVAPPEQTVIGGDYTIEAVAPSDDALVARYEFETDATDSSGNGFDGTLIGDATIADGVLKLDGDGDCVDIGADPIFNPGDASFTISARVNMRSWGGNWGNVIIGKRGEGGLGWQLRRFGGNPHFSFTTRGCGNDDNPQSILEPTMNEWHDVVAVRDGDMKYLYIDGVLDSTAGINTNPVNACDHNVYIGARANGDNSGPEAFLDGDIDSLAVYGRALSEGEVRYLAGVGDRYVPPVYGPLVAHYELDSDASDSSGNGYDGTVVGDAFFADGVLNLDGDADYIDIGTQPWPDGQTPRTLCGWAKLDVVDGGWHFFAAYGNNGNGLAMVLGRNFDDLYIGGYGGNNDLRQDDFWEVDVWHHIAVTYDGATARMYADGIEISSRARNWNLQLNRAYIGAQINPGPNEFWDGQVKDVRVYNYALSAGEVAHVAGVGDVVVPPVYSPCRLSLEFEGDLTDSSGNGNDGTAVGAVGFETDPDRGQVVSLPGGDNQFVRVGRVGLSGNDLTTIACWAKADHTSIPDWTLIFGFTGTDTAGGGTGSHFNIGSLGGPGGCGAHVWGWEETIFSDDDALEWHHYAMTYDGTTIAYYGDAIPMDTDLGKSNVMDLSIRGDRVHVGSRITQASSFPGKVDDARVYDYVLSENELLHVSGIGDKYIPPIYGPMALHLELDGDATDSSGNDNHGTLMGDPQWVAGQLSMALQFAGVPDYVEVPHDASLTVDEEVTVAAWINAERHNSAGGDWQAILAKGNSPRSYSLYTYTNGTLHFSTAGVGSNSTGTVPLNDWVHVAAMVVDGRHQYYINGALAGEGGSGINLPGPADTATVRIGASQEASNHFLGMIDDVRIYDYALTDGQVAGLAGKTADNPISDTWSDLGFVDLVLESGTMRLDTYGWPGLPYYVGEVSRALPFADLTEGGGKALSTWVRGDSANVAALMYMSVADADGQSADVLYDGDLTDDEWQEWNVDMGDLAGVDVTNAADIAIGLAGLDGGITGDLMNVDNIRVYTSRCMPDIVKPAYDLNDDCVVDVDDLMILAAWWDYVAGDPGVWYEYYETWIFGDDIQNAPFDTTAATKEGVVNNFDIGIREQNDWFGFRFVGMITVPEDGDYTFYTSSDDGSMLDIGDTRVVQNYGWHGMQWREGTINLTAGKHPIMVAMFEEGGGEGLEVEYAGPGIARQPIPDDVLSLPPLPAEVDLYPDGDVGWMDVIVMLGDWLDEELWP